MKSLIITSIFILGTMPLFVQNVSAQSSGCSYNGQIYPIGTRIGGYICTPNGWQRE